MHSILVTTLYLIKEKLKSRKVFYLLEQAELNDCYFQPHLDALIIQSIGLDEDNDDVFNRYNEILDKRSLKIEEDNDSHHATSSQGICRAEHNAEREIVLTDDLRCSAYYKNL